MRPSANTAARLSRRGFLGTAAALGSAALAGGVEPAAVPRRGIKLGFDNFAIRGLGLDARQLVDHAVALECDSVFITDFGPFQGKVDDHSLGEIRRHAADRGIDLVLGSWSICPSSTTFKPDWGTAEEHLALGIRMAKALG